LFERAVGGFYEVVLSPQGWRVLCGGTMGWQIEQKTAGIDKILPTMRTDVVLDHPSTGQRIVIDTKFTSIVTSGWYREETLRSGYVYQIYAYLRSQVGRGDALADHASGLLLHPAIGQIVDETVLIQGHAIRFATVDLTVDPSAAAATLRARPRDEDGRVNERGLLATTAPIFAKLGTTDFEHVLLACWYAEHVNVALGTPSADS
jgi:5-methylcytosine-specific restriction enzyme subunit McrC